ncbi:Uma2 family endonuclease [bacterium]|nr:Uma2 family endonuclease [bacterium]
MKSYIKQGSEVTNGQVPMLESGDRLTRSEFECRYIAATHIRKAELIEGVVYVASPLRFIPHAQPHSCLVTWLGTYAAFTPGTLTGVEPTVRLDLDNEPQPDIVLFLDETVGGQARLTADGYLEGVPELVVEIAASSAAIDLGAKKQVYRRNGVSEYIVWQSFEGKLDWFQLVEEEYRAIAPDSDNILRSRIFPGLWLDLEALENNKVAQVLQALQAGLNSPKHTAFINQLSRQK